MTPYYSDDLVTIYHQGEHPRRCRVKKVTAFDLVLRGDERGAA